MADFITDSEVNMIHQLSRRLSLVVSPVLRSQAILHFSQYIDMLLLGDPSKQRMQKMFEENEELQSRVNDLEDMLGMNDDISECKKEEK